MGVANLEGVLARQAERPLRCLAVLALLFVVQINPWWMPTPDSAAYLSIARSLATHHGLRMFGYAHVAYPPGYPLLISPAFWVSPLPFLAISITQCAMVLVLMLGVYRWTIRQTATGAILLTMLIMVNVTLWIYYHRTLSELAFMTTAVWAVWILDRALDGASGRRRLFDVFVGSLLLVLLVLIREAGMLFAVALGLTAILRLPHGTVSTRKTVATITVMLLPAVAAAIGFVIYAERTFAETHVFGTHLSAFFDSRVPLGRRAIDGLRLQICGVGRLLVPGMFKAYGHSWLDLNTLVYTIIFLPLSVGWYRWVRRRADPYALVLPLYLILYAFWDFDADTRYILPMLPAIVVSLWYVVEPFEHFRLSFIALLASLHLAVAVLYTVGIDLQRARDCDRQRSSVAQLVPAAADRPGLIVASASVPECARLFLSLMLDRPIVALHAGDSAIDKPQLILAPASERPVQGFHSASAAGDYVLLVEDRPTTAR